MSISFDVGNQVYRWCGGFGAILKSFEYGMKVGDVRMIKGHLFHVAYLYKRSWFRPAEICWTLSDVTADKIREIQQEFLL